LADQVFVVALLLGPALDVVLGIEAVLHEEARRDIDSECMLAMKAN
jgi:hypothetical protein